MASSLDGTTVLITGASAGIGRAAAFRFVLAGARVLGAARSEERLRALSTELGGPSRFVPLVADVASARSMDALALRVRELCRVPDVVVANAGIGLDSLFAETTDEAFRSVLEVNVLGVLRTVRPYVGDMLARKRGRIVFVSSIVGKRGIPHYSAYSASKFALHGIADALRAELHGSGVSVGIVCPASTETDFAENALREGPAQRRVRPIRHSAESVGRAIVSMARSRRRERILGAEAKLMTFVDTFAPGLIDWILARTLTRRSH